MFQQTFISNRPFLLNVQNFEKKYHSFTGQKKFQTNFKNDSFFNELNVFSNELLKKQLFFTERTIKKKTILLNKQSYWTNDSIEQSFSYKTNEIDENERYISENYGI